jgi:hypothetical protein
VPGSYILNRRIPVDTFASPSANRLEVTILNNQNS